MELRSAHKKLMKALPNISRKLTSKEIEELKSKYIAGIDPYEEGNGIPEVYKISPLTPGECYKIPVGNYDGIQVQNPKGRSDEDPSITTKDEIKQYVAYKGIHEKPKTTESGIGYFEDEIGWYYKQGELKIDTDEDN